MKGKYQERRINREKQWPCCHSDKLVRLELVEREKGDGYSAKTRRGREDEGIKRTPLAYGDLFKVESGKRQVRKVLVEGDAGIGKTTLCIAVSEDWANGKLFHQFELILLLPLRMKAVASAGSLPELLKLLHPSPRLCDSVARYLEDEEGESVLIIADGWDELGESERQEGSFLYQLLFGHRFCLMSVVVTSRPSASAPLRELPDIDRFVEVHGFSKEQIVEYIQSEFTSDWGKADRLREQLKDNPLVENVCSVPLNCAIVCHLWRTLEEALPTTMTELYTKIILNLILRNIRKFDSYVYIMSLSNFDSLPADLQQSWWLLCECAFRALEKDQLVFSQEELDAFFPEGLALDKKILCFGLLQSAESVGVGISFHFLHLTFQEYLAALYLARKPMDQQLEAFRFSLSRFHFKMVWRFIFGINSYLELSGCFIWTIQLMLNSVHAASGLIDYLSVCHCAFEAHNDFINEMAALYLYLHPLGCLVYFGHPRTAHDCSAILYVFANLQECGHDMEVDFSNASENQIKELMHILASKKGKLWISDLDLSGSRLTVSSLQALESVLFGDVLTKLMRLKLEGSLTSDADTNATYRWLTTLSDHCPNLEYLDLSNNNLGVSGASAVGQQLSLMPQSSTITSLDLNHNSFTGNGIHILAGFMHLCSGLEYLHTCNCGITSDDLIWLLSKLKSSSLDLCSELVQWELKDNQIDGRGVSALMDHLPSLLPYLWCGEFTSGIDSLSNNPVIRNTKIMERLEEEVTRLHRKREDELTRRRERKEEELIRRQEREKEERTRLRESLEWQKEELKRQCQDLDEELIRLHRERREELTRRRETEEEEPTRHPQGRDEEELIEALTRRRREREDDMIRRQERERLMELLSLLPQEREEVSSSESMHY